ncbi:huntingtin-interacting protein 1 [Nilaparvata lugens]|uniref:huntingtin-interacting protein 1 n=1 Tax=Nilaparvata lugens TaxID=108931 RepID=UPI00193EAA25|nr:huntingtin-interacting protein 1 [Nilaparvata lugens]
MSSLSLPRMLHNRKTSLEVEKENFEKFQASSISKAINCHENPVKEKHVRSAILGTFHEKCSETFWKCVLRLPLMENKIVAWKFCHVLHKILREGHPQVIPYSQRFRPKIDDIGKLWGHLKEGYGKLIQLYCKLLLEKLAFHRRNPRFPGNLVVTKEELDSIGENDINNYFQMSVEMFDYMDEILVLQNAIFGSLDMSRSNSMTSCGQCILAPLIPIIQDSSQLYDYCVKSLFKLHASVPPDILQGHRTRFLKQFVELRQFYYNASTLQYFKSLIQIPTLPENAPNFLVQAELGTYVTPVVILPPEEEAPSPSTADLVDIGAIQNGCTTPTPHSISPDMLAERDNLIEHLQHEISRQRSEIEHISLEHQETISRLSERIGNLELQLARKDSELAQERLAKEDLLAQTEGASRCAEAEKRAKTIEEKFQKLKEVYTKLREEHIQLIRQKAGVDKALRGSDKMTKFARAANNLILTIKADVDKQLVNVRNLDLENSEKTRLEEVLEELATLQASADAASEQNQALASKVDWVEKSNRSCFLSENCCLESERTVQHAIDEVDNPALSATCTCDYLDSLVEPLRQTVTSLEEDVTVELVVQLAHRSAAFIFCAKATSNMSPDIEAGERMAKECKTFGEMCLELLKKCRLKEPRNGEQLREKVGELSVTGRKINAVITTEQIGDMVEDELASMDKAIEEAVKGIEEMLKQSRAADSGIKLEVNEKILDSCTTLMKAVRVLVQKARLLQAEIVSQGKGSASVKEFYKRNHQWTEGLISAAKAVAIGAKYLLEAADQVVGSERGEQLEQRLRRLEVVASQVISASTVQLVFASRVKADKGSANMAALSTASKDVMQATALVVATTKSCNELIDESDDMDMTGLSLHQAKKLQMELLVRIKELEASLDKERLRFSALRREHFQLIGDTEEPAS